MSFSWEGGGNTEHNLKKKTMGENLLEKTSQRHLQTSKRMVTF